MTNPSKLRAALLPAIVALVLGAAACNGQAGEKVSSLASNLSNRTPTSDQPTQPPTTNETTEPTQPTTEPSTVVTTVTHTITIQTSEATSSAAAASTSTGIPPWVWILAALVVVGVIVALVARQRGRANAAAGSWRTRALDAYARGTALHDRLASELNAAPPGRAIVSATTAADAQRAMDELDASAVQLAGQAPQDAIKAAAQEFSLSIGGLRSAVQLAAQVPTEEARPTVSGTLADRLGAFSTSLSRLRAAAQGQPVPPPAG